MGILLSSQQAMAHDPTIPVVSLSNPTLNSVDYSYSGMTPITNNVHQHYLQVSYCIGSGCSPFGINSILIGTFLYCGAGQCTEPAPSGSGTISSLDCDTQITIGAREWHGDGDYFYATPATLSTLACPSNSNDPVQTFNPGTINRKTLDSAQDWTANTSITNYGSILPNYQDVTVDIDCGSGPTTFNALSVHLEGTTLVTKLDRNAIILAFPQTGDLNCTADTTVGGAGPIIPSPDPDPASFRIITR